MPLDVYIDNYAAGITATDNNDDNDDEDDDNYECDSELSCPLFMLCEWTYYIPLNAVMNINVRENEVWLPE